ncbi:MAG TPA: peptidylprolyl isomerase [Actinomycetota bacterium]
MRSHTFRLVAVPAIVVLLAACGSAGTAPAATVGGTEISDAQLAEQAKLFTFLATLGQQQCGGTPSDGETQEAACNRFTLGNMIQGRFVQAYAEANDLTPTPAEIDDIMANLDQQLTPEKVDSELGKLDLTRTDLEGFAGQVLLFQAVQTAVTAEGTGDEELRALYDDEILQFTTIDALHILVKTRAEADDVYRQVTAPAATRTTFANLAERLSIDTGSGAQGGSLGSAPAANYVAEFAEAAVALQPGQISEPVKTEFGWHVIYLVDEQVTPFAEAKTSLLQSDQGALFTEWLRGQARSEGVEVNPKYGRFDLQTLTVIAVTSTDPSAAAGPADGASADGDEGTPAP